MGNRLHLAAMVDSPEATRARRPLLIDLVRAYEGILLGIVVVLVALVASRGTLGPAEFGALILLPPILMVLLMRRGAARDVFLVRATGAVLGWVAVWALFPVLFLAAIMIGEGAGEYAVFTVLAVFDGALLGIVLTLLDRIVFRFHPRATQEAR